ncbi:hypothetical protein OAF34_05565 [Pirellulaceae bacterium]|nr:hypothetical protein [Pirellulaceae bacterium]
MSDPLNPYQHFLGIEVDPRRPDFGKVFGINKKTSADEIDRLASAVIADLMTAKPEKETKRWQDLVKQLENAKAKLIRRAENIAKADQSPSPPSSVAAYQPPAPSPPHPVRTKPNVRKNKINNRDISSKLQLNQKI